MFLVPNTVNMSRYFSQIIILKIEYLYRMELIKIIKDIYLYTFLQNDIY